MSTSSLENKMLGLEDLEFFQTLQGWDSLLDESPLNTRCSSIKNQEHGFVEDILEEIELDNGFGLNIGNGWLTDRVDLENFELGFSELADLGLEDGLTQLEAPSDVTEDISIQTDTIQSDTIQTVSSTPCLETLLAINSPSSPPQPLSPEQCVPVCFSSASSPYSSSSEVDVVPFENEKICYDTKIGVIISDSAKIAKTLHVKERDYLSSKQYKVQPKVKTVSQRKRKQVQNRDAATRYRIKKKEEFDILYKKAEALEQEHDELTKTVDSLTKEIEYLRKLMVEVYKTKLLKSFGQVNVEVVQ